MIMLYKTIVSLMWCRNNNVRQESGAYLFMAVCVGRCGHVIIR